MKDAQRTSTEGQADWRRSISDVIADELRTDILSAAIDPGQSIKQGHIAEKFKVSQAPVREALRQLASEELVTYQLNCGVRVAPLDKREAAEISALRMKLEPGLVGPASKNFQDEDMARARAALLKISESEAVSALLRSNEEFHEALYAPAGQPITMQLVRQLRRRYSRYLGYMWRNSEHAEVSLNEHGELLNLLATGNAKGAREMLKAHIRASTLAIIKALAHH